MSFLIAEQPVVLAPGEGIRLDVFGNMLTILVSREQTRGAFSVLIQTTPPGWGTPLHTHHREDEALYVLEGEYEIQLGDKTVLARAGSFVFAPRELPHRFTNVSAGQSRMLGFVSPGGLEGFFEKVSKFAPPPDMDKIVALAKEYEVEIHGSMSH